MLCTDNDTSAELITLQALLVVAPVSHGLPSTDPEYRHDPAHTRERTDGPIPPHATHPVPDPLLALAIEHVEAEEVEGRADELHQRRGRELGGVGAGGGGGEERVEDGEGRYVSLF